jgi:hypothetical protein
MTHARWLVLSALVALPFPAAAEDDEAVARARLGAADVRARCVTTLNAIDGVTSVNYAGIGLDYRLMIVVRDDAARLAAREKLGGDAFEGLPVLWSVTRKPPPGAATAAAPPAVKPPPQVAPNPPPMPDCDILRARYGLPALRRPVGGGSPKSWIPCKVWLRAVQGPGGGHSYLYTKHRPGCVFQDGLASAVYREGFLYPFELRGDDKSWVRQVAQDLDSKFPPAEPLMQPKSGPVPPEVPSVPRR